MPGFSPFKKGSQMMRRLKKRLPKFERHGHQHGHLETHRVWHDPIIEIYDNPAGMINDVRCSSRAYDVANRRWYQLDVDNVASEEWMSSVVEKHIRAYHSQHRKAPRWNAIKTTLRGTPVAYETRPEEEVWYKFCEQLEYGQGAEDRFPLVHLKDIKEKKYLSKGADMCSWNGRQAVFKRIEMDTDVSATERAIRNREKLIKCIENDARDEGKDVYSEMERRFNVVPIHAVVVMDDSPGPWHKGTVCGVLMPFAGTSLDMIAEKGNVNVNEGQLLDLTRGIRELNKYDVCHGDICDWNVSLQPSLDLSGKGPGGGKLVLLDLGNVAPDYDGDAKLLAELFLWCIEHSSTLQGNAEAKRRVGDAAFILKSKENFDLAIDVLKSEARLDESSDDDVHYEVAQGSTPAAGAEGQPQAEDSDLSPRTEAPPKTTINTGDSTTAGGTTAADDRKDDGEQAEPAKTEP